MLSLDTSAAIEQRQVEALRRMSPAEKLQLVSDATQAIIELSLAGIRRRHPAASDRKCSSGLPSSYLAAIEVCTQRQLARQHPRNDALGEYHLAGIAQSAVADSPS